MGRPNKYCHILAQLDNDTLYNSTTIARDFRPEEPDPPGKTSQWLRMRHTLAIYARKNLPQLGDGLIVLPYQGPRVAWYGWRWKQLYCHCLQYR